MKYLILATLFIIAGCDVPSAQRRQIFQTPGSNSVTAPNGAVGTTGTPSTGITTPVPTVNNATSGAGFENCSLAPKFSNMSLGSMGFCQSSSDETQIKFTTTSSDSTSRTCIFPTYKDSTGSSTYLGDPQCTYTVASKIYLGKLYKNRQGFESYPLNGIIIMKEELLPGYVQCMQAVAWYNQSGKCSTEPNYQSCSQQYGTSACCRSFATNYQGQVCNTFKSNFANQYVDLRLK